MTNPFEARLRAEGMAPIEGPERGSRSVDASPLGAEMAHAAHEILTHSALSNREREIWASYLKHAGNYDKVVAECACSNRAIQMVAQRVKELMLRPTAPAEVDEPEEINPREVRITTPPEAGLSFSDIEDSLERAAQTAHRIVLDIGRRQELGNAEIKALEASTRMLVLLRRSEMEYLSVRGGRGKLPTPDELHEIAARNKVPRPAVLK